MSELCQLQSVNKEEAEQFHVVGINNVLQLAYADPVDLTLRTNFDFNYVHDCISQALLWLYLEKQIGKVRILGLRGALEASVLYNQLNSDDPGEKRMAQENLSEIAKILGLEKKALEKTLFEVVNDPYTEFLCEIWR